MFIPSKKDRDLFRLAGENAAELDNIFGTGNLSVTHFGNGQSVMDNSIERNVLIFPAEIVDKGPVNPSTQTAAADFTDCKYWFKSHNIALKPGTAFPPTIMDVDETTISPKEAIFNYAVNLSELTANTHYVSAGEKIIVMAIYQLIFEERTKKTHATTLYVFCSLAIPRPTIQYQVFSCVAQNQWGWDYVRAHP